MLCYHTTVSSIASVKNDTLMSLGITYAVIIINAMISEEIVIVIVKYVNLLGLIDDVAAQIVRNDFLWLGATCVVIIISDVIVECVVLFIEAIIA